ncbi:MAG: ABC transporter ATP-binding protein [Firmicutes bacterium]|nr:ABC transporter ATP-binding protein [Bacillota bacterium]
MGKANFIELNGIKKVFGEVVALDDVDFSVRQGTFHGLLGENGAGKSTLMNILYGLYQPDEGEIRVLGKPVKISSPYDSIKQGIGMVHQSSTLVPEFTAVENVMLGIKGDPFSLPLKSEAGKIKETVDELGFDFPLDVKVKNFPAGIRQKIEIVRAIYRGARLLILDEPTTSLVESEFQQLLSTLRTLVAEELTVIFITHKIREVMTACDEVTVLKKGKLQGIIHQEEMTKEGLVKLMFMERDIEITEMALPKIELPPARLSAEPLCEIKEVTTRGTETTSLKKVNLDIYGGEIFGIAAVTGNGEKELARCITNTQLLTGGDIRIEGKSIVDLPPIQVFGEGVFHTPEDRMVEGILPDGSIRENILLGHHAEKQFSSKNLFIDWARVKKASDKIIKEYEVKAPNDELEIRRLSGGNIQRVIIGRAFLNPIKLLVTHNPTSGLDIASVEFIFNKLVELRSSGSAILWVNEDLDELMILCDRIGVLFNGELTGIFSRAEFDKYQIGLLMIGG